MSASRPSWTAFYVGRWKRWVFIEPMSEAATLGLGGLLLMLALAVPAFRETSDDDWLKKSDLAVIVPRPLRQSDRQPRHQAQRLDSAGRFPGQPDQGDAGDRRPPLLRPFRHRHCRHRARPRHQRPGRRRAPGRFVDHPAIGEEPVPEQRAHHRAQGEGSLSSRCGWRRASPRTRF